MKRHLLPRVLFMGLTAAAAAFPASALPPSPADPMWIEPVAAEAVDDAALAHMTGKYFDSNMLVGVRIDLVSRIATATGGRAEAVGALYIRRTGSGFVVQVDSRTRAVAGTDGEHATAPTATATGGDTLAVQGIGQVTQIAGDGNRMANVALVRVVGDLAAPRDFNGSTQSHTEDGPMSATIRFDGIGMQLGVAGGGAHIGQNVTSAGGTSGSILQFGRIAGDHFAGDNSLQLQMMTAAMPIASLQQAGIQQALSAIAGLKR